MTTDKIIEILYSQLIGDTLSADQLTMLDEWISENPEKRRHFVESILNTKELPENYHLRSMIDTRRPYEEMTHRLAANDSDITQEKSILSRPSLRWFIAGAAAVTAITVGIFLFMRQSVDYPEPQPALADNAVLKIEQISPGDSQAVVTLADGDTIHVKNNGALNLNKLATSSASGPLKVDVPRGGEFVVVLEDSTRVWLNSESRLTYPQHFTAENRTVSVSGEAYFDVTSQPERPFIVETGNQRVTVYGTEFNIRSYPEDRAIYTTLSSGSIALSRLDGKGGDIFLSPGKQAIFDKETAEAKVRSVDIERVTGWRHGRFVFEEQSLSSIMRDLSRWYDFEFEFEDSDVEETIFMGSIPRYSNFKTAIAILEKSGGLSFSIKNNKIFIGRKKQR